MEGIRLFLLRIILSAIVVNIVVAKTNVDYKTISLTNKRADKSVHRRDWSLKPSKTDIYKYVPPYLVFNRKLGAYYPYFKFPFDNNMRRTGVQKSGQWKG